MPPHLKATNRIQISTIQPLLNMLGSVHFAFFVLIAHLSYNAFYTCLAQLYVQFGCFVVHRDPPVGWAPPPRSNDGKSASLSSLQHDFSAMGVRSTDTQGKVVS